MDRLPDQASSFQPSNVGRHCMSPSQNPPTGKVGLQDFSCCRPNSDHPVNNGPSPVSIREQIAGSPYRYSPPTTPSEAPSGCWCPIPVTGGEICASRQWLLRKHQKPSNGSLDSGKRQLYEEHFNSNPNADSIDTRFCFAEQCVSVKKLSAKPPPGQAHPSQIKFVTDLG